MGTKVLVTGAGGFIGSHLTEELVRQGEEVRAFVRYNSRDERGLLEALPREVQSQMEVVTGDLKDPDGIKKAVKGCTKSLSSGRTDCHPLFLCSTHSILFKRMWKGRPTSSMPVWTEAPSRGSSIPRPARSMVRPSMFRLTKNILFRPSPLMRRARSPQTSWSKVTISHSVFPSRPFVLSIRMAPAIPPGHRSDHPLPGSGGEEGSAWKYPAPPRLSLRQGYRARVYCSGKM